MTWTRTPQEYPDRADVLAVSRSARWLLIEMYSWANAQLTNGRVPRAILRRISDAEDVNADVAELLREGLLEEPEDGFLILDWTNQEDADTVQTRAARNADKTKRARERKERHLANDHSMCVAPYCKQGVTRNTEGNVTGNTEGNDTRKQKGKPTGKLRVALPLSSPVQSSPYRMGGLDLDRAGADSAGATSGPASGGPLNAEDDTSDLFAWETDPVKRERLLALYADMEDEEVDGAGPADSLDGLIPAGGAGPQ